MVEPSSSSEVSPSSLEASQTPWIVTHPVELFGLRSLRSMNARPLLATRMDLMRPGHESQQTQVLGHIPLRSYLESRIADLRSRHALYHHTVSESLQFCAGWAGRRTEDTDHGRHPAAVPAGQELRSPPLGRRRRSAHGLRGRIVAAITISSVRCLASNGASLARSPQRQRTSAFHAEGLMP